MEKCGRNDPCFCGSGKKFKKCCENKNLKDKVSVLSSQAQSSLPSLFRKTFMQQKEFSQENLQEK